MARHRELAERTGLTITFAESSSPWQRGTSENANGLLRQCLPKGTDLSRCTRADLDHIEWLLNTRPRLVSNDFTPEEV